MRVTRIAPRVFALVIAGGIAAAGSTIPSGWAASSQGDAATQPAEVTLRLHRQAGETLRYRAQISGTGVITLLGQTQDLTLRGGFRRVERTLSQVNPSAWRVKVTIEEPSLTFRTGTDRQTLAMQVPALTETVNDRGEVSEVQGWDPSQLAINAPGMGEAVRPLFGLVQEQGLPEQPLKPGDKWTGAAKLKMPDGSERQVEERFEFVGLRDFEGVACAEIRSVADIPVLRKLPPNAIGMQVSLDGNQHIETTSLLACERGVLVRRQTAVTLDLKTSTVLSPDNPGTMPGAIALRVAVTEELQR